jgi:hypothetical protein
METLTGDILVVNMDMELRGHIAVSGNKGGFLLRLILIFLGLIIIVRLLSIIVRSVKMYSRGSVQHKKKRDREVGEGWIVEDRADEDEKKDS